MNWEWQQQAACIGQDLLFFHPDGERGRHRRARQLSAKAVCDRCPVRRQCREHAVRFPEHYGTWGGLAEEERDGIGGSGRPFGRRVRRASV
ncbi:MULTISPECIES: WhiB family transcriptional regulator [Mycolicibacterium]|uniref:Transcriptional regulator WhiB n=1 Tax=Mycolicibacterium chitae TaxID=1792 RepID=A0A448IBS4_MYCCI|nr:WhiB family transcriptional regulator [Mycolicibacterium chitae]MCV7104906.1 WhiB family transcriptional regulator [Mycolicibacterium chitae]VEG49915.1 transcriptional regulator [Mycolicibacterium chitae]